RRDAHDHRGRLGGAPDFPLPVALRHRPSCVDRRRPEAGRREVQRARGAFRRMTMPALAPKRSSESATEMVQVVLPNDANPVGYIAGGTVIHLIDMAGPSACPRPARSLLVTAAVDDLQFLHPIKVGDLIILKAHVTCAFTTSLEVQVEVYSEETLTGRRQLTSRAFLTFVAIARDGGRVQVPPLLVDTDEERRVCDAAHARRAERLRRRAEIATRPPSA